MSVEHRLSFLVVGAQKCGTTALDGYLRLHPQLDMAQTKETHFFDDEVAVDWRAPDYSSLHAQFLGRPDQLRGEATPITLYWTPAHYRLLRYNPDLRFIVMLRHPTDRAWSHWRMNIRRDLDTMPFSEAIRTGRTRVLEDGEHAGLARHSSYIERGYFARQIASLATLFPLRNMLFLRQSDLLSDPDAVLARVASFLDIASFPSVDHLRLNVGDTPDGTAMTTEDADYLDALFAEGLNHLERLTGVRLERDLTDI